MNTHKHFNIFNRPRQQRGVGIIEIMIALVITSILAAGIIELFVGSKQTFRTTSELSRLQESARYAMYQILKDIRMAGFNDCAPNPIIHLDTTSPDYDPTLFDLDLAVGGWEYTGTAVGDTYSISTVDPAGASVGDWTNADGNDLNAGLQDLVVPGTDVIVIKRVSDGSDITVNDNNVISSANINLVGNSDIPQDTIVMITQDCEDASVFQNVAAENASSLTTGATGGGNCGGGGGGGGGGGQHTPGNVNHCDLPFNAGCTTNCPKWPVVYGPGARILISVNNAYFVGQGAGGEPTLFVSSFNTGTSGTPQEVAEGVENLQVLYGVDTNPAVDVEDVRYVPIDQITAIGATSDNVVAVRISLLMRTIAEYATDTVDTLTYRMGGNIDDTSTIIDPVNDQRLRYVFTSTVKLRNRGDI